MRLIHAVLWLLLLAIPAHAQKVTFDREYPAIPGEWVLIVPAVDGDGLKWEVDAGLIEVKLPGIDTKQGRIFKARKDGRYKVECWTAKVIDGKAVPSEKAVAWVVVGNAPEPGPDPRPDPKPEPKPDPKPNPAPIPADGLHVLLIHETKDKLPAKQQAIVTSVLVRDYLSKKCPKLSDGQYAARFWDVDIDPAGDLPVWQEAWKRKPERSKLPWVIVSNGKTGYEGALPATVEDFLKLLKQYGGD